MSPETLRLGIPQCRPSRPRIAIKRALGTFPQTVERVYSSEKKSSFSLVRCREADQLYEDLHSTAEVYDSSWEEIFLSTHLSEGMTLNMGPTPHTIRFCRVNREGLRLRFTDGTRLACSTHDFLLACCRGISPTTLQTEDPETSIKVSDPLFGKILRLHIASLNGEELDHFLPSDESFHPERASRENLMKSYKTLSDIISQVLSYLETTPDAGFSELWEQIALPQMTKSDLFVEQKQLLFRGLYKAVRQIETVNAYFYSFQQNPPQALENLFGIEASYQYKKELEGIKAENNLGVINFFLSPEAFNSLYAAVDEESSDLALGFTPSLPSIKIPELKRSITISKKTDDKKATALHEKTHQYHLHFMAEFVSMGKLAGSYAPLHRAKDELLAFLSDGTSLPAIRRLLTDENKSYNFFKKSGSEMTDQQRISWEKHKIKVMALLSIVEKLQRREEPLNLNLLAVTPARLWKCLV